MNANNQIVEEWVPVFTPQTLWLLMLKHVVDVETRFLEEANPPPQVKQHAIAQHARVCDEAV
jgi:hypothetical protein